MFKSVVSALAMVAAAGVVHAQPMITAVPTAVSFDGFCDGVTGIKEFKKSGVTIGTHAFENCGGYTDTPMIGPMAMKLDGNKIGVAATDSSYAQFGQSLVYIIKSDGTWNVLSAEGGNLGGGTWTAGYQATGVQGGALSFQH